MTKFQNLTKHLTIETVPAIDRSKIVQLLCLYRAK